MVATRGRNMRTGRLTKRVVDALKPADRPYVAYDPELKGFGVRVLPTGVKSWVVEYRPKGGGRGASKRRLTIDKVGTLTADQARNAARDMLASIRLGNDPLAKRAADRAAVMVKDLASRFLSEHAEPKRKKSTAELYRFAINNHINPALGKKAAVAVTPADVAKLHRALKDRPYMANRTLAVMAAMYSWGGEHHVIPEGLNPSAKVEKYAEHRRERFLSTDELVRLGDAIREAEEVGIRWEPDAKKKTKHAPKPENRVTKIAAEVAAALRLLLLTGARLREILHLRWSEVDLERGLLLLPDSKTGRKAIILNAPSILILSKLPRIGAYVIPGEGMGTKDEKPRADIKRPWALVSRKAGLSGVRLHDLRHTFASFGASSNLGLPIIGKLLGHTQSATTARYSHLADDPVRRASESIGAAVAAALAGSTVANKVNLNIFRSKKKPAAQG